MELESRSEVNDCLLRLKALSECEAKLGFDQKLSQPIRTEARAGSHGGKLQQREGRNEVGEWIWRRGSDGVGAEAMARASDAVTSAPKLRNATRKTRQTCFARSSCSDTRSLSLTAKLVRRDRPVPAVVRPTTVVPCSGPSEDL